MTDERQAGLRHLRCGERLKCPCWMAGAREEGEMHRARPATRELTDYIRALGDADPAMSKAEVAERVYRVFGEAALVAQVPAQEQRLRAARFVATHWRDAVMTSDVLRPTGMSHPLALVLAALDGETDPVQLGISEDQHGAFRRALGVESKEEAG